MAAHGAGGGEVGAITLIWPDVPSKGNWFPMGPLATRLEMVNGYVPNAAVAGIATLQVYSADPSGMRLEPPTA